MFPNTKNSVNCVSADILNCYRYFIAIILVAVSVDWIDACSEVRTDKDMFKRNLTYAEMYEYKDSTYDFVISYPSFFSEQPKVNLRDRSTDTTP